MTWSRAIEEQSNCVTMLKLSSPGCLHLRVSSALFCVWLNCAQTDLLVGMWAVQRARSWKRPHPWLSGWLSQPVPPKSLPLVVEEPPGQTEPQSHTVYVVAWSFFWLKNKISIPKKMWKLYTKPHRWDKDVSENTFSVLCSSFFFFFS